MAASVSLRISHQKHSLIFSIAFLFIFLLSCASAKAESFKTHYEDGALKYEGEMKDGKPHGQGIEYRKDGSKLYEGQWTNGKMNVFLYGIPGLLKIRTFENKR